MKKPYMLPLILFVVFLLIDAGLLAITQSFGYLVIVVAIFLEIAIFGCVIIYLINKHNYENNDKHNDENNYSQSGDKK